MGETFGRYTVVGQLGRGAMGVVYLATDPVLSRQVAVKTVDLAVDDPQEREFLRERLFRDARAAAVLKHPNIVSIYDVFEDGARAYVVMEYVEGDSLAARLKNSPLPDVTGLLKVLRQAGDALDYTHGHGVIHRDIKPANIMIDSTGTTKIMDFGIARITDSRTCTPTGMVMGTVEYMAPEQILGENVDGRADQFALAVVAYQMMTGSTLFGPNSVATLTYKTVNEAPAPPSTRNALLPRGVDLVLAKALSKKPGNRFATCTEFAGALAQAFADSPTGPLAATPGTGAIADRRNQTTVVMPETEPAAPASSGGSRVAVGVAAAVVLLLAGALAAVVWKPWTRLQTPIETAETVTPPATPLPSVDDAAKPAEKAPAKEVRAAEEVKPDVPAAEPKSAPKSQPKPEKTKPEVAVVTPPKPEPPKPEPSKPEPPKETLPTTSAPGSAKDVEMAEPVLEPSPLSPEPKGGGAQTPFSQAMQRGQQAVRADDYPGAIQAYSKALSLRPNAPMAYYDRGMAHHHLQHYEAAMQDFMAVERLDPRMAMAYVGVGNCLVKLHRDVEALSHFQRAVEINPSQASGYVGRAGVYYRRGQYGPALADYDQAIRLNPHFAQAYESRARVRDAIGDRAGAAADRRMVASFRK